jgi:hypothetical protein
LTTAAVVFSLGPVFPFVGMLLSWSLDDDTYLAVALIPLLVIAS